MRGPFLKQSFPLPYLYLVRSQIIKKTVRKIVKSGRLCYKTLGVENHFNHFIPNAGMFVPNMHKSLVNKTILQNAF